MNKKLLTLISAPLILGSASNAALLVHYTFDNDDATNSGTLGDGTAVGGSSYVASGAGALAGRAWQGNRTGANDAYIQTGATGGELGFGGAGNTYTSMAWINWAGTTTKGGAAGDHMVFGMEDGPGNSAMLHHGIRDEDDGSHVHYGGWGNDLNNGGIVTPGEWTHLAWQFDGTDKVIYVNGVETLRGPGGTMDNSQNLPVIIGGHGRDAADPAGQSFNGLIDDVRIYDEPLSSAQIMDAMNAVAVPEPSSMGLLALTGLLFLRRRR